MDYLNQNRVNLYDTWTDEPYRPSGRVNVLLFVPLFLVSLGVAFGMALLLRVNRGQLPNYIFAL